MDIRRHLTRRTSSGQYIPEIDSLRFFAIAAVVLFHIALFVAEFDRPALGARTGQGLSYLLAARGRLGVQFFFCISGFVLGLPFAAHYLTGARRVSLRGYFLRRVTRLEPPYVVSLLVFALLLVVRGKYTVADAGPHLAASLLYLHNAAYGVLSTINGVAWSLEIEVQFYCLAPLLGRVFAIASPYWRRGLLLTAVVLLAAFSPAGQEGRLGYSLAAYLQYFLVGFLFADLYLTRWRRGARAPRWWRGPQVVLRNPWIATIGGMCYSIYLIHAQIISFVGHLTLPLGQRLGPQLHLLVQVIVLLPFILVISALFFVLVERPCMDRDWPAKLAAWWRRRLSPPAGGEGATAQTITLRGTDAPNVTRKSAALEYDRTALGHRVARPELADPSVIPYRSSTIDRCDTSIAATPPRQASSSSPTRSSRRWA